MNLAAALVLVAASSAQRGRVLQFERIEQRVFEAVNQERKARGLRELKWDEALAAEARRHAINMAGRRFFSHVDPVRGNLAERLREDKIRWRTCEENIFQEQGYRDPAAEAVRGWIGSPGHHANMLSPAVTNTGVGVAVRGDGTYFVVQVFTAPA